MAWAKYFKSIRERKIKSSVWIIIIKPRNLLRKISGYIFYKSINSLFSLWTQNVTNFACSTVLCSNVIHDISSDKSYSSSFPQILQDMMTNFLNISGGWCTDFRFLNTFLQIFLFLTVFHWNCSFYIKKITVPSQNLKWNYLQREHFYFSSRTAQYYSLRLVFIRKKKQKFVFLAVDERFPPSK